MNLTKVSDTILLLTGWRRAGAAFASGAVSALALPPFDAWPVLFVTFPVLVWMLDGTPPGRRGLRAAATIGWCFGFGYFLAGLYWIGHAFLVDAKTFGWLLPFAVALLPAGLALFTALGFALARSLWWPGTARVLAFATALTIAEWIRGHVLTGFPWNAFGYTLTGSLAISQIAAFIGLWGLTFLACAIFAAPATLTDDGVNGYRRWAPAALAGTCILLMFAAGSLRLASSPTEFVEGPRLRIMQPNLPQDVKFNYGARHEVMRRYLALSDRATGPHTRGVADVTHLVWPESAFPFFLAREPQALAQIAEMLPRGTVLITGAARIEPASPSHPENRAFNSVYVIDHDGTTLSVYDKIRLVPFGEFLPFQKLLETVGLQQLTKVQGGFSAGALRRPVHVPNAPSLVPLICYEIIFPRDALQTAERPGWLLNVTNDGWFGISTGPYQHLRQARVRAVEEGLPVVRAANTGVSAVIDAYGRNIASLPLGHEGVLDARLPMAAEPTLYARFGDAPVFAAMGAVIVLAWRRRRSIRSH